MKKRTKLVIAVIDAILFAAALAFSNDWVRDHTSSKIAPVMITAMFILMLFTLLFTKTKE